MRINAQRLLGLLCLFGWLAGGFLKLAARSPGAVDLGFNVGVGPDSGIRSVLALPDGSTLVGGDFDYWGDQFVNSLVRLRPDGRRDSSFAVSQGSDFDAYGLWRQADGKILVSGYFDLPGGHHYLVRLNANGGVDETFITNFDGLVNDVVVQPDGRLLVVGQFDTMGGVVAPGIVRLLADGRPDASFQPPNDSLSGFGDSAVRLKTGDYLVAGLTFQEGGQVLFGLLRFRPNGTVDRGYKLDGLSISAGFFAERLQVAPAGGILLSSVFDLWRLTPEGFVDPGFNPAVFDFAPEMLLIQPDGRLLGGDFNAGLVAGEMRRLVRVDADGAVDASFVTDFSASPSLGSPSVQYGAMHDPDRVVVAGNFDHVDGLVRNQVAQVHLRDPAASPVVRWNARQIAAVESGGSVTLTVLREGNLSEPASVSYATLATTATEGVDYTAARGVLNFAAYETYQRVAIAVHDSPDAEGNRQFAVVLSQPVGTALGANSSIYVTVLDDDASIELATVSASAFEITGGVSLPVSRTGGLAVPAAMRWQVIGGSARPGVDFTPTNGVVVFATGETMAAISFRLSDNAVAEGTRSLEVELVPGEFDASLGSNRRATVVIHDNDLPDFGGDGFDSTIAGFQALADGNALAYGNFATVHGAAHSGIVTLRSDGRAAATPAVTIGNSNGVPRVAIMAATQDGGLLLSGSFSAINGTAVGQIARIGPAGSVDTSFVVRGRQNAQPRALAELSDGGILAAAAEGNFAAPSIWLPSSQGGSLVKFLSDGPRDPQFATRAIGSTRMSLIPLEGGGFLASGVRVYRDRLSPSGTVFANNPVQRQDVARFLPSGDLDPSFEVRLQTGRTFGSPWPAVVALWRETNGNLIVAGGFTNVNGRFQPGVAKLLPSGVRDETFDASVGLGTNAIQVTAAAALPDGDILVAFVAPFSNTAVLRRLSADGSRSRNSSDHYVSIGSAPGPTGQVAVGPVLGVLRGGQVFLGFTGNQFDFRPRYRFAWLESDGSLGTDQPLVLRRGSVSADGKHTVTLRTRVGGTCEIQRSENLLDWTTGETQPFGPGLQELILEGGGISGYLRAKWTGF